MLKGDRVGRGGSGRWAGFPPGGCAPMTTPMRAFAVWLLAAAGLFVADAPSGAAALEALGLHARAPEKEARWQQAADFDERALRLHGERPDLRDSWRTAEQRHNL